MPAPLTIVLASPRGFCAGVDRAIQIVEAALGKYGAPVYVRHEIVHNRTVVSDLEAKGAVFVDELDQVPAGAPVIFSAHGVPKAIPAEAARRELIALDATCPLVTKVHNEAERHFREGREVVLVGHAGHPEVIGTLGQLPAGAIHLIEGREAAESFVPRDPSRLAYATQTTLSIDETEQVVAVLRRRFPSIAGPRKEDICYATTNRQNAVKAMAAECNAIVVIGAPNSSNSVRLVEVARAAGCEQAVLVRSAADLDWSAFEQTRVVGITAGASAPERLVTELVAAFSSRRPATVREVVVTTEDVRFRLPRVLEEA